MVENGVRETKKRERERETIREILKFQLVSENCKKREIQWEKLLKIVCRYLIFIVTVKRPGEKMQLIDKICH